VRSATMKIVRSSGILLHPTSLPGRFGIGDLGPECYKFLDFLHGAKQKIWHVLPLGPTGPENSPYQSRSSIAGNPLLLSPEKMTDEGYLDKRDLRDSPHFPAARVNFRAVRRYKLELFRRAFDGFSENAPYRQFAKANAAWLNPFAEFMALRTANHEVAWTKFDPTIAASENEKRFWKFLQYEFFRQWRQVKEHCAEQEIAIMGDMPFYVEHDSADVWSSPELFDLDANGEPRTVGGVPPDYFSRDGQLWGNPTYNWAELKKRNYAWWVERFRAAFRLVDLLRLDHFRGFVEYWSVPAGHATARKGKWVKGPGLDLFNAVQKKLGTLPLVAENLGLITHAVEKLRNELSLPGMVVLQFAFGEEDGTHRPNNYVRNLVSFTGTHDNNTTRGWWTELQKAANEKSGSAAAAELERTKIFLQRDGRDISWSFIQTVMTSVADVSMIPLQDALGLGSRSRMNIPGRAKGNWRWRFSAGALTPEIAKRLQQLTEVSGR
jgi:4-alpha-glucanotransferase